MANTIRHKRGTTAPLAGDLVTGELAIDTATGTVYTKKDDNSVVSVGGGGGLADAPSDGNEYVRKNAAWSVATGGGGGGSAAWGGISGTVTDQTDLTSYISTATSGYLPLAGGTMTGGIVFDAVGGQSIDKGTFDSSRYGYNGISLKCAVGFELNWQSGWLTGNQFLGTPNICPIYIDSGVGSTLRVWEGTTSTGTEVSHTGIVLAEGANITVAESANHDSEMAGWGFGVQQSDDHGKGTTVEFNGLHTYDGASHTYVTPTGITFTDTTVQTTAAIADAPSDSTQYVRQNGSWVTNSGFTIGDSPSDGNYYVRMGSTGWAQIGSGTDAIATQAYVTGLGYATTGDVSTAIGSAVSGFANAADARKQAVAESARAVLNDSAYTIDGAGYHAFFMAGAFNFTVTNSQFSSGGKWFGIEYSSTVYAASSISLSSGVVEMVFSFTPSAGTGLFYTEDGGTTWFESSIPIQA